MQMRNLSTTPKIGACLKLGYLYSGIVLDQSNETHHVDRPTRQFPGMYENRLLENFLDIFFNSTGLFKGPIFPGV